MLRGRRADGVSVESYRPGRVRLATDADAAGLLLVRESWRRGWTASVDGVPAALHRAAGLLFAVEVPAGQHVVELTYRAPGFRLGMLVAAVWLVGVLLAARLRRLPRDDEKAP
jgi:uncharacterized membrane protein YfhO